MDEFFAGLSGFFGEWGWLFILIGGILLVLGFIWFLIVVLFIGKIFRQTDNYLGFTNSKKRRRR